MNDQPEERELKTIKFQMMLSPTETEAIDDWMFKHRIKSRAEAIRRLCQMGLVTDEHSQGTRAHLAKASNMMHEFLETTGKTWYEQDKFSTDEIFELVDKTFSFAYDLHLETVKARYELDSIPAFSRAVTKDEHSERTLGPAAARLRKRMKHILEEWKAMLPDFPKGR